jgi:serine/threonine protein phosphatase PrpC
MTAPFRVQSDGQTHEGRVRPHNEDSYCSLEQSGLWAVADGMGGHERGEWASAVLIEKLSALDVPAEFDGACEKVAEAIHDANGEVYREATARGTQMGSTIVCLLVRGSRFAVFWVGDSRAYLLRGGEMHQLSRDHTRVQEMVDAGLLGPEDAVAHPMGHVLARAVGVMETLELDVVADEIEPGDTFLLCSDGLHGFVDEQQIASHLASATPAAASQRLIEATLANGAPDNVTVIAIAFNEPTLLSLPEGVLSDG